MDSKIVGTKAHRRSGRVSASRIQPKLELEHDDMDRYEVITFIWDQLKQGRTMPQAAKEFRKKHPGIRMTRPMPYDLIRKAIRHDWIRLDPPAHTRWTEMLQRQYDWLRDVRVVRTTQAQDVARYGAAALLRLVRDCRRKSGRNEIHIGFLGGHTIRQLALAFAELLRGAIDDLPEKLVIHAIAAGFDPKDPTMDPITFFSYFSEDRLSDVKVEFRALHAPLLVHSDGIKVVREQPYIKEAIAAVRDIDIIVASGSDWRDEHSALRILMERFPDSKLVLEKEGVVADVAWRPFGKNGPIETETGVRALTLVELHDLPGLIEQKKRVLLTLGPCGLCNEPKGRLLDCLLEQRTPFITDLVVDSRTVRQMLRERAGRRQS